MRDAFSLIINFSGLVRFSLKTRKVFISRKHNANKNYHLHSHAVPPVRLEPTSTLPVAAQTKCAVLKYYINKLLIRIILFV